MIFIGIFNAGIVVLILLPSNKINNRLIVFIALLPNIITYLKFALATLLIMIVNTRINILNNTLIILLRILLIISKYFIRSIATSHIY